MRAVLLSFGLLIALGCKEDEEVFELNSRRVAELANATCSCSDSVSVSVCTDSFEAQLNASLVPQVNAGRIRVADALWTDCIAERRACAPVADACDDLFEGLVGEGESCDTSSVECEPGLRCVADDPDADECSIAGTCEEIEIFERGERCTVEGRCERETDICGFATSGDDEGELICRKPIAKGEPCPIEDFGIEGTQLCERGTACAPDGDEVLCAEPLEEGEPCFYTVGEVSGAGLCKGTFCDPASGVCTRFPFPEGAELGDDCEMARDCQPGLTCIDEECAHRLPNGSECEDDDQCAAHCFEGQCAASFTACDLQ